MMMSVEPTFQQPNTSKKTFTEYQFITLTGHFISISAEDSVTEYIRFPIFVKPGFAVTDQRKKTWDGESETWTKTDPFINLFS